MSTLNPFGPFLKMSPTLFATSCPIPNNLISDTVDDLYLSSECCDELESFVQGTGRGGVPHRSYNMTQSI
jgi:hypothetical protein